MKNNLGAIDKPGSSKDNLGKYFNPKEADEYLLSDSVMRTANELGLNYPVAEDDDEENWRKRVAEEGANQEKFKEF